jgi:hypothetical protein
MKQATKLSEIRQNRKNAICLIIALACIVLVHSLDFYWTYGGGM